jgi:hypothetical protein
MNAFSVAFGGKADMRIALQMSAYDPKRTLMASDLTPSRGRLLIDTMPCP